MQGQRYINNEITEASSWVHYNNCMTYSTVNVYFANKAMACSTTKKQFTELNNLVSCQSCSYSRLLHKKLYTCTLCTAVLNIVVDNVFWHRGER